MSSVDAFSVDASSVDEGSLVVDGGFVATVVPELSVALGCRKIFVHRRPW